MSSVIKLVHGDTRPALVCTITDANTGDVVNLTGASALLKFRVYGSSTLTATLTGTVTDATNGVVEFYWASQPTSLSGAAGQYEGEIEITFPDGQIQTVFDTLNFYMRKDF
jgi:energy-coupling factor transporter ATP-binding protein EcfA2